MTEPVWTTVWHQCHWCKGIGCFICADNGGYPVARLVQKAAARPSAEPDAQVIRRPPDEEVTIK